MRRIKTKDQWLLKWLDMLGAFEGDLGSSLAYAINVMF